MKMFLSNLRRNIGSTLINHSVALPQQVEQLLNENGISAQRGKGNLAAFLEIGALVTIGLFTNPEISKTAVLRLVEIEPNMINTILQLAENCENLAKRLSDSME